MTRERHVAAWLKDAFGDEDFRRREGELNFDRLAGEGAGTMPAERVLADRERLKEIADPIIRHVNKRIAHRDEQELPAVPTYGEINGAVDLLGDHLNRYESLLKASQWWTLVPDHQTDWTRAFTVAWKQS
jgi:hypothetical protein